MALESTLLDLKEVDGFMNREAPKVHDSFGGLSVQENGRLMIPDYYKLVTTKLTEKR